MADSLYLTYLKKRYPDPISPHTSSDIIQTCYYCIGGALLLDNGWKKDDSATRFPNELDLGSVIMDLNRNLDEEDAMRWAAQIIDANDDEKFEEAWTLLGQALAASSYGEQTL